MRKKVVKYVNHREGLEQKKKRKREKEEKRAWEIEKNEREN